MAHFYLFLILLLSCEKIKEDVAINNQVVIVFNGYPTYNESIEIYSQVKIEEDPIFVSYWDGNKRVAILPRKNFADTVTIYPKNDTILFQHNFNNFKSKHIAIKVGDTITINYDLKKNPQITNKNKTFSDFEFTNPNEYNNYSIYSHPELFYTKKSDLFQNLFNGEINKVKSAFGKKTLLDVLNGLNILEHRFQNKELSHLEYLLAKERMTFEILKIKMNLNELNQNQIEAILIDLKAPNYFKKYKYELCENYLQQFIETNYEKYGKKKLPNYSAVFDYIYSSQLFNKDEKNNLLLKYLLLIKDNFPPSDFIKYQLKFEIINTDKTLEDKLSESNINLLNNGNENLIKMIVLKTNDTIEFNTIVQNKNKKIYYVDFWASWCQPCLAEIPESKILKSNPDFKNIGFVYISMDDNLTKWKKRAESLLLIDNSYCMGSEIANNIFKITEIPRYMIFDNLGNILDDNAPRPSDPKVKELFSTLLKEK